jgi:hypothetical protein
LIPDPESLEGPEPAGSGEEDAGGPPQVGVQDLEVADRLLERDLHDVAPAQCGHGPEVALHGSVGGCYAESGGQNPIERRRRAAPLHVAEDRDAGLKGRPEPDLGSDPVGDAPEPCMAEAV